MQMHIGDVAFTYSRSSRSMLSIPEYIKFTCMTYFECMYDILFYQEKVKAGFDIIHQT